MSRIDFGAKFYTTIAPVDRAKMKYTYDESCPVGLQDLRLMKFLFIDFEGFVEEGEIVVNKTIVEPLTKVLSDAYEMEFPLHSARTLDHPDFKGDDYASMEANNSSCFNHRTVAGTDSISMHSYGLAVDINPMMNPYLARDGNWYPRSGHAYIHRFELSRGMFCSDHPLVQSFKEQGFEWGGEWERPDYHHFCYEK